jgi:hypothetical protein
VGLAAGCGFAPVTEQLAGVTALLLCDLGAWLVRGPFFGMHVGVVVLDVGGFVSADVVVVVDGAATVVVGGVVAMTAACAPSAAVAPPTHAVSVVDIASVLARTDRRGLPMARLRSVRKPRSMHVESRPRA